MAIIILVCFAIVGTAATIKLGFVSAMGICAAILLLMPFHPRAQ